MTRYYTAATQAEAQDIVDKIDARARELLTPLGKVDTSSNLIGSNLATGELDPSAQKTTTWFQPIQTLQGVWIVLHPENWASGADIVNGSSPPVTIAQYLVQDLGAAAIQSDDVTWFPPSEHHRPKK